MLRAQVPDATWRTWFEAVHPVAVEDGTLVLAVPSALAKERIEGRYLGLVRDVMADATGTELPVRFDVRTENRSRDDLSDLGVLGNAGWQDPNTPHHITSAQAEPPKAVQVKETPLDLRYTPSTPSSPARPTASPTPLRCRWQRLPPSHTTLFSFTATPGWARPTSCTPLAITSGRTFQLGMFDTSPRRRS